MHARIYVSSPYSSVPSSFSGIIDFCPGGSHFWGYFHPPPSVSNFLQIWLYKLLGLHMPFKKTLCLWENIEKCAFANIKHEILKICASKTPGEPMDQCTALTFWPRSCLLRPSRMTSNSCGSGANISTLTRERSVELSRLPLDPML